MQRTRSHFIHRAVLTDPFVDRPPNPERSFGQPPSSRRARTRRLNQPLGPCGVRTISSVRRRGQASLVNFCNRNEMRAQPQNRPDPALLRARGSFSGSHRPRYLELGAGVANHAQPSFAAITRETNALSQLKPLEHLLSRRVFAEGWSAFNEDVPSPGPIHTIA